MTTLTIDDIRRSIALTTEGNQDAQNILQKVNTEWVSYYKYIEICKQLIAEHLNINEAFMAALAGQTICKTFFAILPEDSLLELFQISIQCLLDSEMDSQLITQLLRLCSIIFCIHPSEAIKSSIQELDQQFIVLFYTYLGEQFESLTFISTETIQQFLGEMFSVLENCDPSPEWVALFASYLAKLGDLTTLFPLLDKLRIASSFPESFSFLFNVASHIFGLPYENLNSEETPFLQPFIDILLSTTNTLIHSDYVSSFDIQKACQYIIEIFEYCVQFACCIENVEFVQSILNSTLEIMSHLNDYHVELLNTVIALAEFFHGTLELVTIDENHISQLSQYPYLEQMARFLSLLYQLTQIDDSESESEEVVHSTDLAKAIHSITSIPSIYYDIKIFDEFLNEVNPGTLFFAAYCTDIFKARFAKAFIQPLLDSGQHVPFAMPFIHRSFVLFTNEQKIETIKYAWQYFLEEPTLENANVVQNCARLGPGFLIQDPTIPQYIIENGSTVSSTLIPALYMILMYPQISISDQQTRIQYISAAGELIQNKFQQIAEKGNIFKVLHFILKFIDQVWCDFHELAVPEKFELVYMKRAKLSMETYQDFMFPHITELCQNLLYSLDENLISTEEEVVDAICEVMEHGLAAAILKPEFVFEWMVAAFPVCKAGSIYNLFTANRISPKSICLMNYLTPEQVIPFIDAIPELSENALSQAYLFISALQKMPSNLFFSEQVREIWSTETFLTIFSLERIIQILNLEKSNSIVNFLPIIQDMYPVSGQFHAPPEWVEEIGNTILQLVLTTYEDESLYAGIMTLVHLCAASLLNPELVKSEFLAAETDEQDINYFTVLFDMGIDVKIDPILHLSVKDAYTALGKIIVSKRRQAITATQSA